MELTRNIVFWGAFKYRIRNKNKDKEEKKIRQIKQQRKE